MYFYVIKFMLFLIVKTIVISYFEANEHPLIFKKIRMYSFMYKLKNYKIKVLNQKLFNL